MNWIKQLFYSKYHRVFLFFTKAPSPWQLKTRSELTSLRCNLHEADEHWLSTFGHCWFSKWQVTRASLWKCLSTSATCHRNRRYLSSTISTNEVLDHCASIVVIGGTLTDAHSTRWMHHTDSSKYSSQDVSICMEIVIKLLLFFLVRVETRQSVLNHSDMPLFYFSPSMHSNSVWRVHCVVQVSIDVAHMCCALVF